MSAENELNDAIQNEAFIVEDQEIKFLGLKTSSSLKANRKQKRLATYIFDEDVDREAHYKPMRENILILLPNHIKTQSDAKVLNVF